MKNCSKCKENKEFSDFHKNNKSKDGYRSACMSCSKASRVPIKMSEEEKIKNRERGKFYRENNKEKLAEYRIRTAEKRKEYDKNRKYNPEISKKYYSKNKNEILSKRKKYYIDNRNEKIEYQKEYQQNNKSKRNDQISNRRKSDPLFRLITNIRNLINNSFYELGYSKNSKTEEILGCSFQEFKLHLESKFKPWMTWENRGLYNGELNYGWDIDHIIPLSVATSEEALIYLNNFKNLQPLCSKINRDIKKNNLETLGKL